MVQLKYFGAGRDHFKYDLMSSILEDMKVETYVFIPMFISNPLKDEANPSQEPTGRTSTSLLSFIGACAAKSPCHWERWLHGCSKKDKAVGPCNKIVIVKHSKDEYWVQCEEHLREKKALVSLDPDSRLKSGTYSYPRKTDRTRYVLNHEIILLFSHLDPSSILMIYQHLPNNKPVHEEDVSKNLEHLKVLNSTALICGYREGDLVFILMSKDQELFTRLCSTLTTYHAKNQHRHKSLHLPPSKDRHPNGLQSSACRI